MSQSCISISYCQRIQRVCQELGCQRGANPVATVANREGSAALGQKPMPTSMRPKIQEPIQRTVEQVARDIVAQAETVPKPIGSNHKAVPKVLLEELAKVLRTTVVG